MSPSSRSTYGAAVTKRALVTCAILAPLIGVVVIVTALPARTRPAPASHEPTPTPAPTTTTPPAPTIEPTIEPPSIVYPLAGPRRYTVVPGTSPVIGASGPLMRFRVAVERGIEGVDPGEVAATVVETLADPRGWTFGGRWRFQRVPATTPYDFIVFLVTPETRDAMCAMGRDVYTSCRNGNSIVLNVARWAHGAARFDGPLDLYREYLVNHEIGHRLGHGHELCPGPGRLAPVMQQQTLGLHGCTPNAWPAPDGRRYTGRSGAYDDPVPDEPD